MITNFVFIFVIMVCTSYWHLHLIYYLQKIQWRYGWCKSMRYDDAYSTVVIVFIESGWIFIGCCLFQFAHRLLFCCTFCTLCSMSEHLSIICMYSPFCWGVKCRTSGVGLNVTCDAVPLPLVLPSAVVLKGEKDRNNVNGMFRRNIMYFCRRTGWLWFWSTLIGSSWRRAPIPSSWLCCERPTLILRWFWVFGGVASQNLWSNAIAIWCSISAESSLFNWKLKKKKINLVSDRVKYMYNIRYELVNVQSALAISVSLQGSSSAKLPPLAFLLARAEFNGKPLRLNSTAEMLRGRGGTAGLPLVVGLGAACTSSELESSCAASKLPTIQCYCKVTIYVNRIALKFLIMLNKIEWM